MSSPPLDVLAIGNAVVDVIAPADAALVASAGLVTGSMRLIDEAEALALHARMTNAREVGGGSAANTAVGIAALGGRAGFIGRAGPDALGAAFAADLIASGITWLGLEDPAGTATARCLILVTPDGQRSMCTFPGAAHRLSERDIDPQAVARASVLLLEGYLWDSPSARAAMEQAMDVARGAGRTVAVSPSDIACIERRGARFRELIRAGRVGILFVNDAELAALGIGAAELTAKVDTLVVTHGASGASAFRGGAAVSVPAAPVPRVVDTTGAGDLFAAGFLVGEARGLDLTGSLRLGAAAASAVIGRFGARPGADFARLIEAFT